MTTTILIIDDSEDDILLTKVALSKARVDVSTAVALSGEVGLDLLHKGKTLPKLILLDLKMPGMSGIEVLRKIRMDEGFRGIPVVILTNSNLESDEQASIDAGADSFLHKSTDFDKFREDMARIIDLTLPVNYLIDE